MVVIAKKYSKVFEEKFARILNRCVYLLIVLINRCR